MTHQLTIQPYIYFNGNCEEALAFYAATMGAQTTFIARFEEMPAEMHAQIKEGWGKKIMHANMTIGDSQVMASDCEQSEEVSRFNLSINVADEAEGKRIFSALAVEGTVHMPFQPTFWARGFGILTDKFGIPWQVNVAQPCVQA